MHKRKQFLIYPSNYKPGDGYKTCSSKFQAKKIAKKIAVKSGNGASIGVHVRTYEKPFSDWVSSVGFCIFQYSFC